MAKKVRRNLESFIVRIIPSDIKYNIVTIPREYRGNMPPYKVVFDLERNNARTGPAWMTSSYRAIQEVGDEEDGQYICGRLREWYENNNVQEGDRARIRRLHKTITSGRLAYRLTHLKRRH